MGKGGAGTLKLDGQVLDSHAMPKSLPIGIGWANTFDVGIDTGTPVYDKDYQVPFKFTGLLRKLTISLELEELTPAERQLISETYRDKQ
jgi:arylsulfatase